MARLEKLRELGKRNSNTSVYKKFVRVYDKSPCRSGQFLKQTSVFDQIKPYIDYTEGKRGFPFKTIELFALRFPDRPPKCKACGKPTMWHLKRYSTFCSTKCSNNDSSVRDKKIKTSIENWGTENPGQSKIVLDKRKKTNLKRLGVEYPAQAASVLAKMQKTTIERHRVDNIFKSKAFKINLRSHNLKKYGVLHSIQAPEVVKKSKDTMLTRHGVEFSFQSKRLREKSRITSLQKYGTEFPIQNKQIKHKATATMLQKYGVKHALQHPMLFEKAQRSAHRVHQMTIQGKTFDYQGYEGHVLKILVNQLGIPASHITTKLTQQNAIWWKGKKKTTQNLNPKSVWHQYSTDIRIKHKGKDISIEVKSNYYSGYTNKEIFNQVKAKAKAAFDSGVDLRLWVVNPKTKSVVRISDFHNMSQKTLVNRLNE